MYKLTWTVFLWLSDIAGPVRIGELFDYSIIDSLYATNILKIHFLLNKLQKSIRMYGGKCRLCLDIDSIPCEWTARFDRLVKYLPAYHHIVIVSYDHHVQLIVDRPQLQTI